MIRPKLSGLKTVLAIGAHPDDIEIGCGGTLLRLLREEPIHIHCLIFSGTEERNQEARSSARRFLAAAKSSELDIRTFPDSYFPAHYADIKKVLRDTKKKICPDLIFTHRRTDLHQDHSLIGALTWNIFRDHLIFEYEIPKYDGDLATPNVYVDLDREICIEKIDTIIGCFPSQKNKTWFDAETFWALLRLRGVESDSASKYAEGFYCRKFVI